MTLDVLRSARYTRWASFADKETECLFNGERVKRFSSFERLALVRLTALHAATSLRDLAAPGLRLELLKGDRKGDDSIRINDQYRIRITWHAPDAKAVEIVDYP